MTRIAIIDDWGGMVRPLAPWHRLDGRATIDAWEDTLADESALAKRLAPYEIVVPIRERTRFPSGLIGRLPALKLLADHTSHCVRDAVGRGGTEADEKVSELVAAVERFARTR